MSFPAGVLVMQAPIGPATTTKLVAAVSNAGGLGTLASSWTPRARLREQLGELRSATRGPYCVNLILAFDQRERLRVALEEAAPAISFSWGVDADLIAQAREAGAIVLVQAGDLETARRAVGAGADVLIAQGVEAGGHVQGTTPLAELLRDVAGLGTPVVAAGGIGTPEAARQAIDSGAAAVACGTAYLAADEANVHPRYLERLLAADASDTVLTDVFDVGWPDAPHRVLRSETSTTGGRPGTRPGEGDVVAVRGGAPVVRYSDALPTGSTDGDIDAMALYAGMSVAGVQRRESAAEITRRLASLIT